MGDTTVTRAALVDADGTVHNIVVLPSDDTFTAPDGMTAVDLPDGSPVGPGWVLDGDDATPPLSATTPAPPTLADLTARAATLMSQLNELQQQIAHLRDTTPNGGAA